jgi:hypothetical protein
MSTHAARITITNPNEVNHDHREFYHHRKPDIVCRCPTARERCHRLPTRGRYRQDDRGGVHFGPKAAKALHDVLQHVVGQIDRAWFLALTEQEARRGN